MNQQELMKVNHFLAFLEHNNPSEIARILADKGSDYQINEFNDKLKNFQNDMVLVESIFILKNAQKKHEKLVEANNEIIRELHRSGFRSGVLSGHYLKVV